MVCLELAHPLHVLLRPGKVRFVAPIHIASLLLLRLADDVPLHFLNEGIMQVTVADDVAHLGQL